MTSRPRPRDAVLAAFRAAIDAADPGNAFNRFVRLENDGIRLASGTRYDLAAGGRVWLVGAGKATAGMAVAASRMLGGRLAGGTISVAAQDVSPVPGVAIHYAGHPIPDDASVAAADHALSIVGMTEPEDLVLCLLSGGASALWTAPPAGVSLEELRDLTTALLRSGAPIAEINSVRSRLSRIAGGRLAAASRAPVITLAISDVIAAPVETIGSGPTLPTRSSADSALRTLSNRGIAPADSILSFLRAQADEQAAASPDLRRSPAGANFHVIASIDASLTAAEASLRRSGYHVITMDRAVQGEARQLGRRVAEAALEIHGQGEAGTALIWGGETTVTVTGTGIGGRNQELALAAAIALADRQNITVASLATDGVDGPTAAAGAIVDGDTIGRAVARGLDPVAALHDNDSHRLLAVTGDLVYTGPTGTNVNDLTLAVID